MSIALLERIDVASLREPFPGSTVGSDVREGGPGSELYLRLKDSRATARLAERDASNAETDSDPLNAGLVHWSALAEGATTLLSESTKDLEIAAWLTEALLRLGHIAGLADGFALLDGLISSYWDSGLWPVADEDGDETRLAALFGLFGRGGTGTLLQPLKLIALSDRGETPVTLWSAELAVAPAPPRLADEDAQALVDERRAAAQDAVASGIGRSSRPFLVALHGDLQRALQSLEALMQTIDRVSDVGRFGSQIGEPLAAALRLLEDHAGGVFVEVPAMAATATADAHADTDDTPTNGTVMEQREPISREDALTMILGLAEYFEQREPQSPIGLSLREVVRRGRLPLETLLSELLPDAASRTLFLQRAGIRSTSTDVTDIE